MQLFSDGQIEFASEVARNSLPIVVFVFLDGVRQRMIDQTGAAAGDSGTKVFCPRGFDRERADRVAREIDPELWRTLTRAPGAAEQFARTERAWILEKIFECVVEGRTSQPRCSPMAA